MAITLAAGGTKFDVTLLDDLLPGSSEIKVEATGNQSLKLAVGTAVSLQGNSSVDGDYTVALALAPAAPRSWRLYLNKTGSGSSSSAPVARASSSAVDNRDKVFVVQYSGAMGANIRKSVQSLQVSYPRLSAEISRITRSGSKIVSITELA